VPLNPKALIYLLGSGRSRNLLWIISVLLHSRNNAPSGSLLGPSLPYSIYRSTGTNSDLEVSIAGRKSTAQCERHSIIGLDVDLSLHNLADMVCE
jgi:hypothetical protein